MASFGLEDLIQSINAMYGGSAGANIHEIDRWLSSFQQSPQAWSRVDEIFSRPSLPLHVSPRQCYIFAAMTLKTKLIFDFAEVISQDMTAFRHHLFQLLIHFKDVSP
jgi:hypothetical protein